MSFIQREIDKLMAICQSYPTQSEVYQRAYYMKQALSWALEPDGVASPTALMHKFDGMPDEGTKGTGVHWNGKVGEDARSPVHA